MPEKSTIERAFELAREGNFKSLQDVRHRLVREGYSEVTQHLSGLSIRRQLWAILHEKTGEVK